MPSAVDEPLLAALGARYEFLDSVARSSGSGGWVARQRETGAGVRLRIVPLPDDGGESTAAKVVDAINNAARLHHAHIARVRSVASVTDTAVVVETEWMPGRTLREILVTGTSIPPGELVRILRAVGAALEFAHRAGMVHGAVHPGNIMLDDNTGRVQLAGFGEPPARVAGGGNDGAPSDASYGATYAAPEQRYGGVADVRTDLYGLGLVGWHALTGGPPPTTENLGEVLFKQALGGPAVVRRVPGTTPTSLLFSLEG